MSLDSGSFCGFLSTNVFFLTSPSCGGAISVAFWEIAIFMSFNLGQQCRQKALKPLLDVSVLIHPD